MKITQIIWKIERYVNDMEVDNKNERENNCENQNANR